MLHGSGQLILPEFLPENLRGEAAPGQQQPAADKETLGLDRYIEDLLRTGAKDVHAKVIDEVERILFLRVLRHTGGHQSQAADVLGLNRATLRHKLRALGLTIDKIVTDAGEGDEG
jgi:two-component system, NtrC family, nitrogen regulation response regulator GlnG